VDPSRFHAERDRVLWHIVGGQEDEKHAPKARWWHDNRERKPSGIVVFQVVLAGRCVVRTPTGDHDVLPGQAFLFAYDEPTAYGRPPDRPDWVGWSESLVTAHLSLGGAGLVDHWRVLRARAGEVFTLGADAPCLDLLRDVLRRIGPRARVDRRANCPWVHAFVMALHDAVESAAAHGLGPVESALDDLLRAPLSGLALKAIARKHGVAREHLTRVFTARHGVSPARWLRHARIARAQELLRATELPLAIVAAQSGFSSPRTLSRVIQAATGKAPGALRQSRQPRAAVRSRSAPRPSAGSRPDPRP